MIPSLTTSTTLDRLAPGTAARIVALRGEPGLAMRLMEMGLLEGETVRVIGAAPLGDPIAILLRGARLALRRREAALINVELLAAS